LEAWRVLGVRLSLSLAALAALVALSGCLAEEGPPPPFTGTTWEEVNVLFTGRTCQSCHPFGSNLATTRLDYPLLIKETGTCTTNSGKMVEPYKKEQSCLWLSVTAQEGSTMLGAQFSSTDTDLLGSWIDDGAVAPK